MSTSDLPTAGEHEPTWEVAHLFPAQGHWTESEYFELHSNRMVELVDGKLEILPMPTWMHQLMVDFLTDLIKDQIRGGLEGRVLQAPLPIKLFPKTIREPDVMYFAPGSEPSDPRGYPTKVDLAMEVVSEGSEARRRDYEDKRRDYAKAGVPEYWIIDPETQAITVMILREDEYTDRREFSLGMIARGELIEGLEVNVSELMKLTEKR